LEEIEKLEIVELDMKAKVDILKEKEKDLGEELQQFAGAKSKLKKYRLEIDDLLSFANMLKEADELGYDARLIGSRIAYWDELEKKELDLAESVLKLEQKKDFLEQRIRHLEAKQRYYSAHGYGL
jgi:hypothetical protein